MTVGCPTALLPSLAPFLRVVERYAMWEQRRGAGGATGEPLILEWGISNTTLEEVFLRLVAEQVRLVSVACLRARRPTAARPALASCLRRVAAAAAAAAAAYREHRRAPRKNRFLPLHFMRILLTN